MILGLCCAKDSEMWIEEVLRSHLCICDRVLFLDDGSADRTGEIARGFERVTYFYQAGWTRNEARDRNNLFAEAHRFEPDWCWWFDGDETVYAGSRLDIESAPPHVNCLATQLLNMWGDAEHYAADWSHPKYHIFRYIPETCRGYEWTGRGPHQIHCGGRPRMPEYESPGHRMSVPIVELHWGWLNAQMAEEKLSRYRNWDPAFSGFRPYRRFQTPPTDIRRLEEFR